MTHPFITSKTAPFQLSSNILFLSGKASSVLKSKENNYTLPEVARELFIVFSRLLLCNMMILHCAILRTDISFGNLFCQEHAIIQRKKEKCKLKPKKVIYLEHIYHCKYSKERNISALTTSQHRYVYIVCVIYVIQK